MVKDNFSKWGEEGLGDLPKKGGYSLKLTLHQNIFFNYSNRLKGLFLTSSDSLWTLGINVNYYTKVSTSFHWK